MKGKLLLIFTIAAAFTACSRYIAQNGETAITTKGNEAQYDYMLSEAYRQKYLGSMADAVKLFEECKKSFPEKAVPYFELAQIYSFQGNKSDAKINALRAEKLEKDNYWYKMFCGGLYSSEKNIDSAIVFFEGALKLKPDDNDIKAVLGQAYLQAGDLLKAEKVLRQLTDNGEYNETDIFNIVNSLIEAKHFKEAEEWTKKLVKQNTEEVKYQAVLAEIYRFEGKNNLADSCYNSIIASNPNDGESQMLVMNYLIEKEDYENASSFLGSILENNSITRERKVDFLRYLLNDTTFVKTKFSVLESNLIKVEGQFPNDEEVYSLRAQVYEMMGLKEKAIERYYEIRKENKSTFYSDQKLIILLAEEKRFEELFNVAKTFATNYNKSILGKVYYGIAAVELKKYDIAEEEFDKAMILAGNDEKMQFSVLSAQADLEYRQKNFEKSFTLLESALKIEPEDAGTLNNYAYYLAENNSDLKRAFQMAAKAIKKEPQNGTYIDTYGWVLYKMGKYKPALKEIKRALDMSKDRDPELLEHMGYVLKSLRKCDEAVNYWQESLKRDPAKTYLNEEIEKCKAR
ncbi:MAG TPA: tetratricopeptide repeat protein [Bacteroidales bacterium]|nr:tetratricopeptide repeat protein [Bacteroidales bacterium]